MDFSIFSTKVCEKTNSRTKVCHEKWNLDRNVSDVLSTYSFSHGFAVRMSVCCFLSYLYISSRLLTVSMLLLISHVFIAFLESMIFQNLLFSGTRRFGTRWVKSVARSMETPKLVALKCEIKLISRNQF